MAEFSDFKFNITTESKLSQKLSTLSAKVEEVKSSAMPFGPALNITHIAAKDKKTPISRGKGGEKKSQPKYTDVVAYNSIISISRIKNIIEHDYKKNKAQVYKEALSRMNIKPKDINAEALKLCKDIREVTSTDEGKRWRAEFKAAHEKHVELETKLAKTYLATAEGQDLAAKIKEYKFKCTFDNNLYHTLAGLCEYWTNSMLTLATNAADIRDSKIRETRRSLAVKRDDLINALKTNGKDSFIMAAFVSFVAGPVLRSIVEKEQIQAEKAKSKSKSDKKDTSSEFSLDLSITTEQSEEESKEEKDEKHDIDEKDIVIVENPDNLKPYVERICGNIRKNFLEYENKKNTEYFASIDMDKNSEKEIINRSMTFDRTLKEFVSAVLVELILILVKSIEFQLNTDDIIHKATQEHLVLALRSFIPVYYRDRDSIQRQVVEIDALIKQISQDTEKIVKTNVSKTVESSANREGLSIADEIQKRQDKEKITSMKRSDAFQDRYAWRDDLEITVTKDAQGKDVYDPTNSVRTRITTLISENESKWLELFKRENPNLFATTSIEDIQKTKVYKDSYSSFITKIYKSLIPRYDQFVSEKIERESHARLKKQEAEQREAAEVQDKLKESFSKNREILPKLLEEYRGLKFELHPPPSSV